MQAAMLLLLQVSVNDEKFPAKLRATFNKLDADMNGTLDRYELHLGLSVVNLPGDPPPSTEDLVAKFDRYQDGKLRFDDFARLMRWVLPKVCQ